MSLWDRLFGKKVVAEPVKTPSKATGNFDRTNQSETPTSVNASNCSDETQAGALKAFAEGVRKNADSFVGLIRLGVAEKNDLAG
jgi:hypothetical protein